MVLYLLKPVLYDILRIQKKYQAWCACCNPSYVGGERRITVQVWSHQKLLRPYPKEQTSVVPHICGLNYVGGRSRRITV
jgi:hypothetical protein